MWGLGCNKVQQVPRPPGQHERLDDSSGVQLQQRDFHGLGHIMRLTRLVTFIRLLGCVGLIRLIRFRI